MIRVTALIIMLAGCLGFFSDDKDAMEQCQRSHDAQYCANALGF